MNDIIAGDPAPTNPTARETLDLLLTAVHPITRGEALDAYRAEVQAELANWLVKKAYEYQSLRGKENAARVEVLCRMAAKIRRGAVRPGFKVAAPDPLVYGPRGYRCGCGKDAHSNLVPCAQDPADRAALRIEILTEVADLLMEADETAAALLVDRLLEGGESRG
ncbi:hypothetical protein [Streptomyces virginiae]|uniref:hypothetical protein n=1 Tax=Streptomyces virginiae TaxID=1961 RepID=UPI0022525E0A|nr:hypothetical protein [Streptomyces virginiae]MCX5176777.1 hypothetical protein [Streptomyces virginiae]